MNISGASVNLVTGNILTGYYLQGFNRGHRGRLFEFSSPLFPISNFSVPFDAILFNKDQSGYYYLNGAGRRLKSTADTVSSDRSGVLYYNDSASLVGICHGWGRNDLTHYSGANFYNAFYPAGYYLPPYGENLSIFQSNQDGYSNLNHGACAPLSITEYNEQFGIPTAWASNAHIAISLASNGQLTPLYTPAQACPEDTSVEDFYEEINYKTIQGTTTQLGGGNFYNYSPIPTSLDSYDIKVSGRYQLQGVDPNRSVVYISGRAAASYTPNDQESKLNNTLCLAQIMETDVAIGHGANGQQLLDAPDALQSAPGDQASTLGADPFHYWHFTFRENADTLPFSSDFTKIDTSFTTTTHRSLSQGTQMIEPVLSSDDYYWQNRQCPDTVDFLPYNLGGAIYACPSEHFDVPYYAATKKFGFYGTRFLNTCNKLNLQYPINGVENASELPTGATVILDPGDVEPPDLDSDGSWNFFDYDNLLRTAKAEERYSNMYALNKGFFIWANTPYIQREPEYQTLSQYSGFVTAFSGLYDKFQSVYSGGLSSFLSGEPTVTIISGEVGTTVVDSGTYSDLLFSNKAYDQFLDSIKTNLSGNVFAFWLPLEDKYAYYVSNGNGINEAFYSGIIDGREKRIRTRYFENLVKGNPIDLFPMNHISFSFDRATEYLQHTGWGRKDSSFGKSSLIPEANRRYFEGAYGASNAVSGLTQLINGLQFSSNSAYYPGFFNSPDFGKDVPITTYVPVFSGYIRDNAGHRFSPSGWLAAGYNEIGALDQNFSCFTPIFVQQPLPEVFCKVGSRPTLRALAVDYHSIPEDKISVRYPEIIYWAYKLKIIDQRFVNLYPLKYSWHRILKEDYNNILLSGDFGKVQDASSTGEWCCLEGSGPNCTVIHPNECYPKYDGNTTVDHYTFLKGARKGYDDKYLYYCMVTGRFGIRMSEPTELKIEDWLRFDASIKNGINAPSDVRFDFEVMTTGGNIEIVSIDSIGHSAYDGYQFDPTAIPECVVEEKVPPPNAGFGDVSAFRFIGPISYVGASRSWSPSTVYDTRGLREQWGRFIEYGSLTPFGKHLTQQEGDLLYGYQHLPVCNNYSMNPGQYGVRVTPYVAGFEATHWTLGQKAYAALDSSAGMKWDKLSHIGELYPPMFNLLDTYGTPSSIGAGHWQWGNNLGSVKRFGYLSDEKSDDIRFAGQGGNVNAVPTIDMINKVKKALVKPSDLAGYNCGYHPNGAGRNMLYYIEAFDRFYSMCDPVKKKNIQDIAYMNPGLRQTNSAIQYFWLGQPSNIYVERRPMYGPYAYQWRIRRHNRDRNGNGMSEGFYSMGWHERFTQMYDAPAIYGLYVKKKASPDYAAQVQEIIDKRNTAMSSAVNLVDLRSWWFGLCGNNGGCKAYGNITYGCDVSGAFYRPTFCDYVESAKGFGSSPDLKAYGCNENQMNAGVCFDPCLSMRYGQGLFPGGKAADLFGYEVDTVTPSKPKNARLVPMANYKNDVINYKDEQSVTDKTLYFRAPVNTPHARIWRQLKTLQSWEPDDKFDVQGISPCKDGGSDHCNFMTATIHLGTSTLLQGEATAFTAAQNYIANVFAAVNIRGDNG